MSSKRESWEPASASDAYWRVRPDLDDQGPFLRVELGSVFLSLREARELVAALVEACTQAEEYAAEDGAGT